MGANRTAIKKRMSERLRAVDAGRVRKEDAAVGVSRGVIAVLAACGMVPGLSLAGVQRQRKREDKMRNRQIIVPSFLAALLLVGGGPAEAQFNGHNGLGDFGMLSGTQPSPGFYAAALYMRYATDLVRNRDGDPIGFDTTDPAEITVNAIAPVLWWVTDLKVMGANYGAMVALPFLNTALEVPILDRRSETGAGLGDLYVQPVNLGWHLDQMDFTAGLGFFAPVGRYEVDADDNTGLGMWSLELYGGASVFLDQAKSWHLATTAFYETHSKKKDSDTKVGDILTLEGGAGKSFLEGALSVGASYYAQWKLSDDDFGIDFELPGGRLVGKHRVYGIGPELTLPVVARGKLVALVNARYFWETGARTKTEGQALIITATFPVPSLPVS